jgi:hypothetical protein
MTILVNSAPATGTGTVTIAAPVTNSNQTITLPDETGTLYSSATPVRTQKGVPAFSAYNSAAQSIPSTTYTKLQFQTEEFDTTNAFDSTTNYRFQPAVAGYYQVGGGVSWAGASATSQLYLYKNGMQFKILGHSAVDSTRGFFANTLVYLNGSTDYIELYFYLSTGQNTNPGQALVYFTGSLIAAA